VTEPENGSRGMRSPEGLGVLEERMPDLIVLDLGLPDADGLDVELGRMFVEAGLAD